MKSIKSIVAIVGAILISASCVSPSLAATGTSIAPEIMNQSKGVASVISSRIHVLWSDYINKQLEYTNDPDGADAPQWATELELADMVGGTAPDGITFEEADMPTSRDDSFYLKVTVGSQYGGAASARYVKAYLPTATVEGNVITVPVTRPSKALELADLHLTEFTDVSKFEMAEGADITMDQGDITGANNIYGNNIYTLNLDVEELLTGNKAEFSGNVDISGSLTIGENGNNGHIYLGKDGYIHGSTGDTITIAGDNNTSMLAKLVIYLADSTQFKGDIELVKNGVTTTFGSQDSDSFTINSTEKILLSQSGTTIMEIASDAVNTDVPMRVAGDILPMETNKYNIGSSSLVWDKVYANSLRNGSGVYIDLDSSKIEFGKNGDPWGWINSDG